MAKKKLSELEETLSLQLRAMKLPIPQREYRFAAHHVGMGPGVRKRLAEAGMKDWRFDFSWIAPSIKLAVECDGGGWLSSKGGKGGHTTGSGFADDLRKHDAAMRMGWCVYRCDLEMIKSGRAISTIRILIEHRLK